MIPGIDDLNGRNSVRKRGPGLAKNSFGNELADAIGRLGQVPHLGIVPRDGPWGDTAPLFVTHRVNLTQTGGSAGNKTTPVSFTYTVTDLNGTELATAKAPEWPSRSENGLKVAATKGIAYIDADGDWQLAIAFERAGTTGCS